MELNIYDKPPTVCLNMIVKNEAHIIRETLEMLCNKITFSYWVICDTGSTDNTKEIIYNFFKEKQIEGEMFDHPWQNFAHNRTLALENAFNKSDLLFIFDADDEIHGKIDIPLIIDSDGYFLDFGSSAGISYQRVLLVRNSIKWEYKSVIHEYINCLKPNAKIGAIKGDYYIVSGRRGSRSKDPNKYLNDAKILEEAYYQAKKNNDNLYIRYGFYCANSYKDAGKTEDAIKWYKIALGNDNWSQEKYMCCLNLYNEYNRIDQKEIGFYYLVESFKYDAERLECVYYLILHYSILNLHNIAYKYYSMVSNFYENIYLTRNTDGKLFIEVDKANFYLPYHIILVADKVKETIPEAKQTIIKMYEIIFTKKHPITEDFYIGNLLYNLQFFIEVCVSSNNFISLFQNYIDFLEHNMNINLYKHQFLKTFEKYGIVFKCFQEVTTTFSKTECKNSNKILFYTGFSNLPWNYTYSITNALGGSETAVSNLAKSFPNNYEIYISGSVSEEKIDNITYINLDNLRNLVKHTSFHTVIVSRYIAFYEMFPETSFYQSFIWGHDIALYPYGCNLDVNTILHKWNAKITGCICQTEWHANLFIKQYSQLKDKIITINNGILIDKFIHKPIKFTNRFIYTSCAERGLDRLLELWPQIIQELPDAELFICSYNKFPQNDFETQLHTIIEKYDSIKHMGTLNKENLYEIMSSAEFWLYPTNFNETSCITSMEMLMSDVICIYYPIAGLVNTLGDYGIPIQRDQEISTILNLSTKQKHEIRKRGKEYALSCSWNNRSKEWCKLLLNNNTNNILIQEPIKHIDYTIKIVNLKNRIDRRDKMIEKLNAENIYNYEFFEAVNGKTLNCTNELISLFNRNDFNYNKGVIGCALSHLILWKKLISDKDNNFYVILEDDINLCDNFKIYLDNVCNTFVEKQLQHLALGEYFSNKPYPDNTIKIETYSKDLYKEWNVTFAYIISKSAAIKAIEYINTCSIKCAFDNPQAFGYILNYTALNVKLVNCDIVNENGTDIQTSTLDNYFNSHIIFTNTLQKTITLSFCDWWSTEYCGGNFEYDNNFFTNLLKIHSNNYIIKLVSPHEKPDVMFYSIFGNSNEHYEAKRKIFFSGEPYSKRENADFNLTFDENSLNNTRTPLWICYIDNDNINKFIHRKLENFNFDEKTHFCSFIASGPGLENNRKDFVDKLSKYKKVDCGGNYLNNIGYNVPLGINCSGKIEHNRKYKFAIAFESKSYPGYVTEKICDIYKSNCIPIYWGHPDIVKDFNPNTFINSNNFSNFDDMIEYVIKIDNNDELYKSFFKQSVLSKMWIDILNDPNKCFFKNLADKIISTNTNLFDNLNNTLINNQEKYYAGNKIDEFLSRYIFKGYKNGYFIDIGANDGLTINNTLYFEKYHNWVGINIEPLDEAYNKLIINRPNSINLNLAIDNTDGETEFIYNTGYTEMISGLKKTYDPRHFERLVNELNQKGGTSHIKIIKTKTIKSILEENQIKHINYLSIDVEGGEQNVLDSIDFENCFIDVISFEDNFSDITKNIIKFMKNNNYILIGRFGDIIMIHKDSKFIDNLDCDKITSLTYENFQCYGLIPNLELKNTIIMYNTEKEKKDKEKNENFNFDTIECDKTNLNEYYIDNKYTNTSSYNTSDKNYTNNNLWIIYAFSGHNYNVIEDYINSLKEDHNIFYTQDIDYVLSCNPTKISYIMYIHDDRILNKYKNSDVELSFLNTEPLSISYNLDLLKEYIYKYPYLKIYDYSFSNLHIILQHNMYCEILEYKFYEKENILLKELNLNEPKIYDFGIITYGHTETNTIDSLAHKKKDIVIQLITKGFKIHIISGWGIERDKELAKCKVILNIHSILGINGIIYYSKTFENIRCNRLLDAGFKILSEDSIHCNNLINKYKENLKFINYDDFKNIEYSENFWDKINSTRIKKVCFIHSCNIENVGTYRLDYLVNKLNSSDSVKIFDKIYILNIGLHVENIYGEKYEVINYSDNIYLYENPTINLIKTFSESNPNTYILYLHTKGVSFDPNNNKENDWIDLMLYFLVDENKNCINMLDNFYDVVGCNYSKDIDITIWYKDNPHIYPPHYSGNFWWANSNYLRTLPLLSVDKPEKMSPEFWLFKNNPIFYNLHSSNVLHYSICYPRNKYVLK